MICIAFSQSSNIKKTHITCISRKFLIFNFFCNPSLWRFGAVQLNHLGTDDQCSLCLKIEKLGNLKICTSSLLCKKIEKVVFQLFL